MLVDLVNVATRDGVRLDGTLQRPLGAQTSRLGVDTMISSRAIKSIYYMAVQKDPRVRRVVAGSPPRFSYSAFAALEEGKEFLRAAAQARQHIEAGHGKMLLEMSHPFPLLITAEVFMQKYGPDEKYDILRHLP